MKRRRFIAGLAATACAPLVPSLPAPQSAADIGMPISEWATEVWEPAMLETRARHLIHMLQTWKVTVEYEV